MKKVLIISYYWPPSGGVGVYRYTKMVKYIRDFGWEPIVYAPLNAHYPYLDATNFKDVPDDVTVIRRKIFEPFSIFKKISGRKKDDTSNPVYVRDRKLSTIDKISIWIRGNFFIPDARCFWIRPSVRFLKKYLSDNHIDAIFTSGPPHTCTVIGSKLSRATGIPCLADFQDPWTQVDYYEMLKIGKFADKKHHKLEQEALNTAKKTTIVSPSWKVDLENIGAKNVDVVYLGYDEDDFSGITPEYDEDFSIVHAGQLGYDRRPDTFLKVLGDLKKENPKLGQKLKIKFAGTVDYIIQEMISENDLTDNYVAYGNIPRQDAINLTLKSHLLLLPLNIAANAKGRIPGKIFENMRARRPVLCLGPKDSDVAEILRETQTGITLEYNDYEGIKKYILEIFERYEQNKNHIVPRNLEKYSVRNQTGIMVECLNEMLS